MTYGRRILNLKKLKVKCPAQPSAIYINHRLLETSKKWKSLHIWSSSEHIVPEYCFEKQDGTALSELLTFNLAMRLKRTKTRVVVMCRTADLAVYLFPPYPFFNLLQPHPYKLTVLAISKVSFQQAIRNKTGLPIVLPLSRHHWKFARASSEKDLYGENAFHAKLTSRRRDDTVRPWKRRKINPPVEFIHKKNPRNLTITRAEKWKGAYKINHRTYDVKRWKKDKLSLILVFPLECIWIIFILANY